MTALSVLQSSDPPAGSQNAGRPVEGVLAAIGETPLVRLRRLCPRTDIAMWAKIESANPGGSMKDRVAVRMLDDAIGRGEVRPGTTIIESTSGNLGMGLAQACLYHGLPLICVVDSRTNESTLRTLRAFGANVRMVTEPDPVTGDLLAARLAVVRHLLSVTENAYWPNQYASPSNPAAHAEGTMREIDTALDGHVDYLFVATSTTGTLRGCRDHLRANGRETKIVAVDSTASALFGGSAGCRSLPGFGAGVETALSRSAEYDHLVRVDDVDCVVGCRRLLNDEAVFAGGSSGAVVTAALRMAPSLPAGSRCALILPDGGTPYLTTVYDDTWVEDRLGHSPDQIAALVRQVRR